MEQFVNPIKKRNQAEYNLMTEEQKQLIDGYENVAVLLMVSIIR